MEALLENSRDEFNHGFLSLSWKLDQLHVQIPKKRFKNWQLIDREEQGTQLITFSWSSPWPAQQLFAASVAQLGLVEGAGSTEEKEFAEAESGRCWPRGQVSS